MNDQQSTALASANANMARYREVRRKVASSPKAREMACALIANPPRGLRAMRLEHLLAACPGLGGQTIARLLDSTGVPGRVRLGELKVRERLALIEQVDLLSRPRMAV